MFGEDFGQAKKLFKQMGLGQSGGGLGGVSILNVVRTNKYTTNGITVRAENVSNITQNRFLKPVNKHRD